MKLKWTAAALKDRERIFDYTEEFNPAAAIHQDRRISECMTRLIDHPWSGRVGRVKGTHEVVVIDTPFVAVYGVCDEEVIILRVLHTARIWPESLAE